MSFVNDIRYCKQYEKYGAQNRYKYIPKDIRECGYCGIVGDALNHGYESIVFEDKPWFCSIACGCCAKHESGNPDWQLPKEIYEQTKRVCKRSRPVKVVPEEDHYSDDDIDSGANIIGNSLDNLSDTE